jgi:hypothetical protein
VADDDELDPTLMRLALLGLLGLVRAWLQAPDTAVHYLEVQAGRGDEVQLVLELADCDFARLEAVSGECAFITSPKPPDGVGRHLCPGDGVKPVTTQSVVQALYQTVAAGQIGSARLSEAWGCLQAEMGTPAADTPTTNPERT